MLHGLGEPLNEARQLVKDLQFRNVQEAEQGEIDLLRSRLAVLNDFGLLETPEGKAAALAALQASAPRKRRLKRSQRQLPPTQGQGA